MKNGIALLLVTSGLLFEMYKSGDHFKTDNSTQKRKDAKLEAFKILDSKCNACHRKKNPFMVFSQKNMEKRAPKIYQQVFVEQRMPKGNEINLTKEEYQILKKWLSRVSQLEN